MSYLRIKDKNGQHKLVELSGPLTTIGASRDCDIYIADAGLPEVAAHIVAEGDKLMLAAASRKVPMLANGRKRKRHALKADDQLRIGDIEFSFHPGKPPARQTTTITPTAVVDAYQALHEFSESLMASADVPALLESMMDAVVKLTVADKGFLILVDDSGYHVKVARNFQGDNLEDSIAQLSDSIVKEVVSSKRPVLVSDANADNAYANAQSVIQLNLTSAMCAPLLHRGKLLGAIYVGSNRPLALFDKTALSVLKVFAAQASLILANALAMEELKSDNRLLHKRLERIRFGSLVGSSEAMQNVFAMVEKVAPAQVPVLITGETGTGKELIAQEIHRRSPRTGAFVPINCGAIPADLLESELFGHVKGAFTGASADKRGKFQEADGGTLFLDEIGEMPLALQVKLLRVLQEREVRAVGASQSDIVDIRVLAATHRDLPEDIENGRFREDLYYRLNVIHIEVPPLRDRGEDVLALARYFLSQAQEQFGTKATQFTPQASLALKRHQWPGNIRELQNRIQKAVLLADGVAIDAGDLNLSDSELAPLKTLAEAKEAFQLNYVLEVVDLCEGNRTKAAKLLGVDPRTIFRYLKREDG